MFKLISVNGIDFRIIDHYEAVKLLKEANEFLIVAKFSPYGELFRFFKNIQIKFFSLFISEYKKSFVDPSITNILTNM